LAANIGEHITGDVYRITGAIPEDEQWKFFTRAACSSPAETFWVAILMAYDNATI
jgi:hypothetical protein